MNYRVNPQVSYRLSTALRKSVLWLIIASGMTLNNDALQAADRDVDFQTTVTQWDSMFQTVLDPTVSPGKGQGWKPYNRWRWFYGQRADGSGVNPIEARMAAWEVKRSTRSDHNNLDENWTAIGPNNLAGRMLCLAYHPSNHDIIFAGSASGGLWKTTNNGLSWFPLTDDLPSLAIGTVALDPTNPDIIYIGTGEGSFNVDAVLGAGIFKSTDGGATWNSTGLSWTQSQGRAVNEIVIDPNNPQILYAATNSSGNGVYKSTNGGASWIRYHSGDVKDLEMHPDSSNVLYCANGYPWGSSGNGIYRSSDSGVTWTLVSSGLPAGSSMGRIEIDIYEANPEIIYAGVSQTIYSNAGLLGIYKTTNSGGTWTEQATSPNMYSGQGWYNLVIAVDPANPATVYSAGLDLYKSTDSGVTWTRKTYWSYPEGHSLYAHADHHALAFKPGSSSEIIIGTDGGIFRTYNAADTWHGLNTNLVTYQFYAMCNDALQPGVAFGGTQDNGTNRYTGSTSWDRVYGGDGGYCNVDFTNSNIVYCTTQRGYHRKSTNGGGSFSTIMNGIGETGAWVTPRVIDPSSHNTLYTGTTRVYRSTDAGGLWTPISGNLYNDYISTIAVAPSDPNTIYVGYEGGGRVFKSTDHGSTWQSAYSGLPYKYVTRIAVHPTDANTVYVTVSGYSSGHVWKSTDGGSSWTDVSTGLPNLPVNTIVIDQGNPNVLYAGNDLGVYQTINGASSWSDFSSGLPNVVIDDLALHPTSGVLRAATHGRGMWETSTGSPSITVAAPNGGEEWLVGEPATIAWGTGGLGGNVKIELDRTSPLGAWETIVASTANDGSYSWTVSGATTTDARIRVTWLTDTQISDESNNDFSIIFPSLVLGSPNGGETWTVGESRSITWQKTGLSGDVQVYLNRNYPSGSWEFLQQTGLNSYNWTVTSPTTSAARVQILMAAQPTYTDLSASNFEIVGPSIEVLQPNTALNLTPGTSYTIRWNTVNLTGGVDVLLNRNYPAGGWETLVSSVSADSLVWTVDQYGGASSRIRVRSVNQPTVYDDSDVNFTILTPTLTVTSPNGGESWLTGTLHTVQWSSANLAGPVNVSVNRSYPTGDWQLIAINETDNEFNWTVDAPFSTSARIKVESVNLPGYYDQSNANFEIADGDPRITVMSPNGGEEWQVGSSQTITWTRNLAEGPVTIQINRNYPIGQWETLATGNSGNSQPWTVAGATGGSMRIRVYLTSNPSRIDDSDGNFAIIDPHLTLTYPVGGEAWILGEQETITWTRNDAPGNVTVQLMRNYPSSGWETITTNNTTTSQAWTVSGAVTENARVRVYLTSNPSVGDTSVADFAIVVPAIHLISPNGGEQWEAGTHHAITWSRNYAPGGVDVLVNRDYPGGAWETLFTGIAGNTTDWLVNVPATEQARIRIVLASTPSIADESDNDFTILHPALTITSPNGGEEWLVGEERFVTFIRNSADGAATVQYMLGYPGGVWQTISSTVTGNSVPWTLPGAPDPDARVRVILNSDPAIADTSNADFAIVVPTLTMAYPNGGEQLVIGNQVALAWDRFHAEGPVTVWIDRNFATSSWEPISTSETGNTLNWIVTGPETANARLKVSLNSDPAIAGESSSNFAVVEPRLTVLSPNGGEEVTLGTDLTIRWSRVAAPGNVSVWLNRAYSGGAWELLTDAAAADSFVWSSEGSVSANCRVKVARTATGTPEDVSDANFSIIERSVELLSHHGGTVYVNSVSTVELNRTDAPGPVTIQLDRTYPSGSWETLTDSETGSSFQWNVSGAPSTQARLRVSYNEAPFIGDTSAADFVIDEAGIALHAPSGGELWAIGSQQSISWTRYGFSDNVRIELNRDYPAGGWELLSSSESASSLLWTVTGPATDEARVRVTSVANGAISVVSAAEFSIAEPRITLAGPGASDEIDIGFEYTIRFSRFLADGNATISLNRNYPAGDWEVLGTTTADSLVWTPDAPPSGNARLRVIHDANPAIGDTSGAFTLYLPSLTLTSPVGGEQIRQSTNHVVTWSRDHLVGGVRVDLNSDYPGGSWTTLIAGVTGNSYTWPVSQPLTDHARIRVVYEPNAMFADSSDADFRIFRPELSLLEPNGGESLIAGEESVVQWSRVDHPGPVSIRLNRFYPAGTWETVASGLTANSHSWFPQGPETEQARVKLVSDVYPDVSTISANNFEILEPGIRLDSPDGGEVLAVGSQQWFRWRRVAVGNVDVLLQRDYPNGSWESLATNLDADSILWTVNSPTSDHCRVKVIEYGQPSVSDQSTSDFAIMNAVISFAEPQADDTFAIGVTNLITISRNAAAVGNVQIELDRNYPSGNWEMLGTTAGSDWLWTATAPQTGQARLRATLSALPDIGDTLDFDLVIDFAGISIIAPTVSSDYLEGELLTLAWQREKVGPGVNVQLNRNYPAGAWELIAAGVTNDYFDWAVTAPRSPNAMLRVISVYNPALGDSSPVFAVLEPEVELLSPHSGTLGAGNTEVIEWARTDFSGPVSLAVNYDYPLGPWEIIASEQEGNFFAWTVGSTLTADARIRVRSDEFPTEDVSDSDIHVVQPTVTVTSLNEPAAYEMGQEILITWTSSATQGDVRIDLNRSYPDGEWETLAEHQSGISFAWTLTGEEFVNGRVRVSMQERPEIFDVSNANIGTYLPDLYVVHPNGGDTLVVGEPVIVRWQRNNASGTARVRLSRDYPTGEWETLGQPTSADSIVWTPDLPLTESARIKVELVFRQSVYDYSDEDFSILEQSLELLSPETGDSIAIGDTLRFTWQRIGVPPSINVYLKRNYPSGQWELLGEGIGSDVWDWIATPPAAPNARFRILYQYDASLVDMVGPVHLGNPEISVTSPLEPTVFIVGSEAEIAWQRSFANGLARVEVSRDGVLGPWEDLGTTYDNHILWNVDEPESEEARFRVTLVDKPGVAGSTAFDSEIAIPRLTISTPQSGDEIAVGRNQVIAWERHHVPDPVDVLLDRGWPLSAEEMIREAVTGDSIHWIVTGPEAENPRFILRTHAGVFVEESSGVDLRIADPHLTLASPVGGESFVEGEIMSVSWIRETNDDPVRIDLNRNYPSGEWLELASSVTDSFFHWSVAGPATGNARVRITSEIDGELSDLSGDEITIIVPTLSLDSPTAADRLPLGFAATVNWTRVAVSGDLNLYLSRDGGASYPQLVVTGLVDDSYEWTPSGDPSDQARLKLVDPVEPSRFAESESFVLALPGITLSSPNGGESIPLGSEITIQFSESDHPATVDVLLNRSYPTGEWEAIASGIDGESYVWTADGAPTTTARIRAQSSVDPSWFDESDTDFTLIQPALAILSPAAGTELIIGDSLTLAWQRTAWSGPVQVLLRRDGGESTVFTSAESGDELRIEIPEPASESCWLIVEDTAEPTRADSIPLLGPFAATLTLTSPTEGERWIAGEPQVIRWSRDHAVGDVEVLVDSGLETSIWESLGSTDADSFIYTPLGFETENLRVLVRSTLRPQAADSLAGIRVVIPSLSIDDPADAELRIGNPIRISWQTHEVDGDLHLELNRDYPSGTWEVLYTGIEDSYEWTVAGDTTQSARFRVISGLYPQVGDTTDTDVTIYRPSLMLTIDAGDTLFVGDEISLTLSFANEVLPATIALQTEPEGEWQTLLTEVLDGTTAWTVTGPETDYARFRAYVEGDPDLDYTTEAFTISARSLTWITELPAEVIAGADVNLQWQPVGVAGPFHLTLLRSELDPETLQASTAATSFDWTVTAPRADAARLAVTSLSEPQYADTTDTFAIRVPELAFVYPVESGTDTAGAVINLEWAWIDGAGPVQLDVSFDSLSGEWTTVDDSVDGSTFACTVPDVETDSLRFRVTSLDNPAIQAVSAVRSVVLPQLTLNTPGGTWYIGQQVWVQWSRNHAPGEVELEVNYGDRAEEWVQLATTEIDSFLWTVEGPPSDFAALRLSLVDNPALFDTTDAPFRIAEPFVTIVEPNGGEILDVESEIRIRWAAEGFEGGVSIGLWRGEPLNQLDTLFLATENDSSEIWQVTGPACEQCWIVMIAANDTAIFDTSDAPFTIHGGTDANDPAMLLPTEYSLSAAYPNPFNSATTIDYALPRAGDVDMRVYNVLGREVAVLVEEFREPGYHRVRWNARDATSGIYFLRMTSGDFNRVRKLHLIR